MSAIPRSGHPFPRILQLHEAQPRILRVAAVEERLSKREVKGQSW